MVWYSHFFKNFPQFAVIHTAKGFSIVNEAEVDQHTKSSVFLYTKNELSKKKKSFTIALKTIKYLEINVTD